MLKTSSAISCYLMLCGILFSHCQTQESVPTAPSKEKSCAFVAQGFEVDPLSLPKEIASIYRSFDESPQDGYFVSITHLDRPDLDAAAHVTLKDKLPVNIIRFKRNKTQQSELKTAEQNVLKQALAESPMGHFVTLCDVQMTSQTTHLILYRKEGSLVLKANAIEEAFPLMINDPEQLAFLKKLMAVERVLGGMP